MKRLIRRLQGWHKCEFTGLEYRLDIKFLPDCPDCQHYDPKLHLPIIKGTPCTINYCIGNPLNKSSITPMETAGVRNYFKPKEGQIIA